MTTGMTTDQPSVDNSSLRLLQVNLGCVKFVLKLTITDVLRDRDTAHSSRVDNHSLFSPLLCH